MEPVDLFYSYAHEDEKLRDELDGHLALLRRKGVIRPWHDRGIVPGQKWDQAIDAQLTSADLILLLVSMDFMNSDYIWGKELATAIARAERDDASVVPVLLRAVDIEGAPFAKLQGLPTDLRPVTSWPNRDEAWTDVAKGIRRTVEAIQQRWANTSPPPAPPPRGPGSSAFGMATAAAPEVAVASAGAIRLARNARADEASEAKNEALVRRMIGGFADALSTAARVRGVADISAAQAAHTALKLVDMPEQKRVLWVDDKPAGNRHEIAALAKLQVEVVSTRSTDEALTRLDTDEEGFDLVLSDWSRPEAPDGAPSAGLKLLHAVVARPQRPPVIFYHGEFDPARRAARRDILLRAGAFGEAVYPGELLDLVGRALASA